MTQRDQLIAYLATLAAIIVLFVAACICLYNGKSVEAVGIGGVMTGLIGVLGAFRPQQAKSTGSTESGDVNLNKDPAQ